MWFYTLSIYARARAHTHIQPHHRTPWEYFEPVARQRATCAGFIQLPPPLLLRRTGEPLFLFVLLQWQFEFSMMVMNAPNAMMLFVIGTLPCKLACIYSACTWGSAHAPFALKGLSATSIQHDARANIRGKLPKHVSHRFRFENAHFLVPLQILAVFGCMVAISTDYPSIRAYLEYGSLHLPARQARKSPVPVPARPLHEHGLNISGTLHQFTILTGLGLESCVSGWARIGRGRKKVPNGSRMGKTDTVSGKIQYTHPHDRWAC